VSSSQSGRILIVDDDEAARYVKSRVLRRHGYAVLEVSLGRDALALAAAEEPHLTLLDVKLPDLSGIEVCREIKSRFPNIIVLQTSAAFTGVADRTRALDGGADSYLVEPIEPDELVATVNALLRMRDAEQEARRISRNLEQLVIERTRELAEANRRLGDEIADRRKAEAVLRHIQKLDLMGQMTGGIAHDFNNLLTVISGNLELVQQAFDSGAKLGPTQRARFRQLLDSAQAATERAAKITQQLLSFARRSSFMAETVSVTDLLAASQGFLRRAAGEAIEVAFVGASDWHCRVDPVQLEAAILNLVVNARDAMPRGGRLRIENRNVSVDTAGGPAERGVLAGDYVQIVASDTGTGMPPEVVDRAFEPFFTTKEVGKGSGLGLSQVYGFIKQSGGHILIDSTPGEGTAVILYLPRSATAGEPSATAHAGFDETPGGNEVVLIVDDDEDVRDVSAVIAGSLGYEVLTARDATEALALIRGRRGIDLLVSDIVMSGGVDGFELARRARALCPGLSILLMSGYPDGGVEKCEFPILHKPYHREELARHIRAALGDPVAPA
jgi:signal transduction histidine kinase